MKKKELIERVCDRLKECNKRKKFTTPKHTFHISDNEGNKSDFLVREVGKSIAYTQEDVSAFIEAFMDVVEDALKHGDEVSVYGFGAIAPHYRAARSVRSPVTGEDVAVEAHYVPKFNPGNRLRMAVRLWELSEKGGD